MRRVLIGLAVLLGLGALGGYLLFRYKTRDMILDQATVEALAARLLPGARPPAGYQGVAAIVKEPAEVAILAKSLRQAKPENLTGDDLRFVIAGLPAPTGKETMDEMRAFVDKLTAEQEAQGIKKLDKQPALMRMKGRPLPVMRSTVQVGEGGPKLREVMAMFPRDGKVAILVVSGPESSFNSAALQTFLDGLLVEPPKPDLGGLGRAKERLEGKAEQAREKAERIRQRAESGREQGEARAALLRAKAERVEERADGLAERAERARQAEQKIEAAQERAEQVEERVERAQVRMHDVRQVREVAPAPPFRERRQERRERPGGPFRP